MNKPLLLVSTFLSINSFAQNYSVNFANNDDTLVKIDTFVQPNIWQIGNPQKLFFDSAYSKPNAICTDTLNYYPSNNQSSFTVKIFDSTWPSGPFLGDVPFSVKHKYDTDTLNDGGFIEISFDGGNTWSNIVSVPNIFTDFYYSSNTITGGITGFSGKSGWKNSGIIMCNTFSVLPDSIFLKFTFISDSIQQNKEGWMIDNIEWATNLVDLCGSSVGELSEKNQFITITPNPIITSSTLEFTNHNDKLTELEIYNSIGKRIANYKNISNNKLNLEGNIFSEGLYFYTIKTQKGYSEAGKFIVE